MRSNFKVEPFGEVLAAVEGHEDHSGRRGGGPSRHNAVCVQRLPIGGALREYSLNLLI